MRASRLTAVAAVLGLAAAPAIPSPQQARPTQPVQPFEGAEAELEDCFSLDPPAAAAVPLVDDTTTPVPLHVRVLLDVPETPQIIALRAGDLDDRARATAMMDQLVASVAPILEGIRPAYDPLAIDVGLSYDVLTVYDDAPSTTRELIQAGKDQYGGATPMGVDAVYVASENLVAGTTAGTADCVGGLAWDPHSFASGRIDRADEPSVLLGARFFPHTDAVVFAHEVGHLLGAHHHLMNCVEPAPAYGLDDALAACTLMVNDVGLARRTFSTVNAVVVRGYANDFAGSDG